MRALTGYTRMMQDINSCGTGLLDGQTCGTGLLTGLSCEIGLLVPQARPVGRPVPQTHAFTLIELLVVIAIISLLISILTPSLARARQQAKATVCLTRLSEFMKGLTAYGNEHNFALPPMRYDVSASTSAPSSGSRVYHGWAEALYTSLYRDKNYRFDTNFPVQRNLGGEYDLFADKEGEPLTDSTGHYRVYELSWSLGSLDAVRPRLPLITDGNPQVTDANDLLRSDVPNLHIAGLLGEAFIDERHYGGANFAFPDGHAERSTKLKSKLALDWDLDPTTPNQ